ncbi:putative Na+/H+ antiporter [Verrucomicrobiaceae bacterium N1E253]|uniref:Putative Na+/H+ antiporter n=1 Tax=Oceaniferula marina TaxID=2748318 RepID=A0A851GS36_9BACT|nr:putative Na+/H+ antiporter [Oceaniferula marina]NWK57044.1 putative Na+/H+ antiporter [Oceaniferula marina]
MSKPFLSILLMMFALCGPAVYAAGGGHEVEQPAFKTSMDNFAAEEKAKGLTEIGERLSYRVEQEPFLLVASIIFVCAIIHTFFAVPLTKYAHQVQHDHDARVRRKREAEGKKTTARDLVSFKATFLHFFGEIEAIFGIWVIALIAAIASFYDVSSAENYIKTVNFTEPMFVVVIMALASTRPVLRFAEACLGFFARWGKETPAAWWLSIMIVAPILGSFITEPGAMTIAAMLLAKKFYSLKPTAKFAYATIGLLFVNVSVGGVLTNFAAPPVLMVASKWDLSSMDMMMHYGDKAIIGIITSTLLYYFFFRKELNSMSGKLEDHNEDGKGDLQENNHPVPLWVTISHLGFMAWTVYFSHTPAMFIGGFLFFLAFRQATEHHQTEVMLRGPILVGFFLAGLVIHGGLQGWWLAPLLTSGLGEWPLFVGSVVLTSFNDNAAITFLASQVDGLGPTLKYAVLAGAVSGGGLTVIANAPNPAGQALLGRFFGDGVSPGKLLMGALIPTVIVSIYMMCIPDPGIKDIFGEDKKALKQMKEELNQPLPDASESH